MSDLQELTKELIIDPGYQYGVHAKIPPGQTDQIKDQTMDNAPEIYNSTEEERRDFINGKYHCISDCDMCGLCKVIYGKDPENAYARKFMAEHGNPKQWGVGLLYRKAFKGK